MLRATTMLTFIGIVLLASTFAAGESMAQQQVSEVPGSGVPAVRGVEVDLAQIDALHRRRDQPGVAAQIEQALLAAGKALPEAPGVLWRAARWRFWLAEVAASDQVRESMAKSGWELAERAVKADPESADARYWAAANCGTYADTMGVLNALSRGLEGKLRVNLDFMVQRRPDYEWGGPLLMLGAYYGKLPWPKRDRKKAVENLRAALKLSPANLRARVYLAEVLLAQGEAEQALKLIEEVLAATPGAYDAPEERHCQKLARAFKPKIEEVLK